MTTTSHFQVKPDYFSSEKECIESEKNLINTFILHSPAIHLLPTIPSKTRNKQRYVHCNHVRTGEKR